MDEKKGKRKIPKNVYWAHLQQNGVFHQYEDGAAILEAKKPWSTYEDENGKSCKVVRVVLKEWKP